MSAVSIELRDGIAWVRIDNPPVNALGQAVRAGLRDVAAEIDGDENVQAVVLHSAGAMFVAGADIQELGMPPLDPSLPDVIAAIEGSRVPWVAAINGHALGGGLELAMACHARIAHKAARLGLPEVTLGTIPGAGGTVRLPRLVPMPVAIGMVTGGKPIEPSAALQAGLIDAIAQSDLLIEAEALAHGLTAGRPPTTLEKPLRALDGVDWPSLKREIIAKARGASAPGEASRRCAKVPNCHPTKLSGANANASCVCRYPRKRPLSDMPSAPSGKPAGACAESRRSRPTWRVWV
ncbi:enoyl-CoA hydratase-related protein [Mesorhizobium sp.]|uniref:enoyl-CoA hydratase/isomerase family protein n=1 Tax=Mesorhizobium sp. TaxID=1871066 RepID=UPI00257AF28D|nr:enoyl-CoA hydratase-related protein [Mesorhizobium sp.]